jgi:hypothetical protein
MNGLNIEFTLEDISTYFGERLPALAQTQMREWRGACPIHNGTGPNFAVNRESGHWFCHSQCQCGGDIIRLEQELSGVGFHEALLNIGSIIGRDLSGNVDCKHNWSKAEFFPYNDENQKLLFHVCRADCLHCREKRIWQQTPDGGRRLGDVRRILYRLHRLVDAKMVYIVEGEPKVHALATWDLIATCNPGGAGNWRDEYSEFLAGKKVVVVPDNDPAGESHANKVVSKLLPVCSQVAILRLPGLPPKGDIVDWQAAGHTKGEFLDLVDQLKPIGAERKTDAKDGNVPAGKADGKPDELPLMQPEAFYGVVGDFVRLVEPHSEADPAALLVSALVAFGNYLTRNAYYLADGSKHFTNEFAVIVGQSSRARKGTSWGRVRSILKNIDEGYLVSNLTSGLSSGEGLIWAVRNPITTSQPVKHNGQVVGYEEIVADTGVDDKRRLVEEGEFARVLKAMQRERNTLSAILREAWDHGNLNILTKNQPARATDAHISVVAHITVDELRRLMTDTDAANGFANRFVWVYAKRSKLLPFGGNLSDDLLEPLALRVREAAEFAAALGPVQFDAEAAEEWVRVYPSLSDAETGLVGSINSRSEAHAVRLALLYALLDLSHTIRLPHLRAALEVVAYSRRSARHVFGVKLGDSTADEILKFLLAAGDDGRTRNDIYDLFGRNVKGTEISRALQALRQAELASMTPEATNGRPAERWYALRVKSELDVA